MKKKLTREETVALVEDLVQEITPEALAKFREANASEVSREYQIIILKEPSLPTLYTELILQQTAMLLVWIRHNKDKDDGWNRPRKPRPQPLTPTGTRTKILEPA